MTHFSISSNPHTIQTEVNLKGVAFAARRAQVAAIKAAILTDGKPEIHADSTALCTHFKLRRGLVGSEQVECQLYTHAAGQVIRFWVYGASFEVRVRDLVMLQDGEKGWDCWLDTTADGPEGKLFPHEGKYLMPALRITMNSLLGQ